MKTLFNHLFLCILLFPFLWGGCTEKQSHKISSSWVNDTTGVTLTVDATNYPALPYDSVINDISFVRLETNDDCLIAQVSQILCKDSLIFIVDHKAKQILTFNRFSGKFLYPISRMGQGPGEFYGSRLCNISLSASGNELVVFDFGKICYFSLSGNFLREERVSWDCKELRILPDGKLCSYTSFGNAQEKNKPMLSVYHGVKKFHYGAFPCYQTEHFCFSPNSALDKFGDKVYYCDPFSSTFYEVTPNGVQRAFTLDIQGVPKVNVRQEGIVDEVFSDMLNKTIYSEDFIILKDKAVFEFRVKGNASTSPFAVYSMKTGKIYCCDLVHTRNPLFAFHGIPDARDGDHTLVVARSSFDMLRRKEWLRNFKGVDMKLFNELYNDYTEDNNPVLFFFHIKEDL